jgi:hypothetical protein
VPWGRWLAANAFLGPAGVALFALVRPDLWMVERVVFVGREQTSVAELRHLMDLSNGTPPWRVDTDELARAVERHPWVREARVELHWPDELVVQVDERHAAALLHDGDDLLYVDERGVPFVRARGGDLDHVHLTGMGSDLDKVHPDLAPRAIHDALWLVDTLDREGLVPEEQVSEISFSRTSGFLVHTGRARLAFGHADLPKQVERLSILVARGLRLEEPHFVDLAPATVAIVRPLDLPSVALPPPVPTVGPMVPGQGG